MILDPALARDVLMKNFKNFPDNSIALQMDRNKPLIRQNPFINVGEKWKELRNDVSPAMTPLKVKFNIFALINCKQTIISISVEANVPNRTQCDQTND